MNISKLIQTLESVCNLKSIMKAMIGNHKPVLYIDIFGNSNNIPIVMASEDKPFPGVKTGESFLKELKIWAEEENKCDILYLNTNFKYTDGSYDFRYFKLDSIVINENIVLVFEVNEKVELREHFDAVDEDMFDED